MPYEVYPILTRTDLHINHVAERIKDTHERIAKLGGQIITTYTLSTLESDKKANSDVLYIVADIPEQTPTIDVIPRDDSWVDEG